MTEKRVTIREVYALLEKMEGKLDKAIKETNIRIDELDQVYVTRIEFWPVKTIVYGGAGIVLISVLGGLLYLVGLK